MKSEAHLLIPHYTVLSHLIPPTLTTTGISPADATTGSEDNDLFGQEDGREFSLEQPFHHHHQLLVLFLIVQEKNLSVSILNMAVVMPTMMCAPCRDENSDTAWYFHLILSVLKISIKTKENLPLFPPETRDSKTENLFSTPWGQSSHYGQVIHMKILIVTCFSESISVAMAFRIWKWRRQF